MKTIEKVGLTSIVVSHTGFDDGHPAYEVVITHPQWQYVDNTLRGGHAEKPDTAKAFGSLVSFMQACAEADPFPHSENHDLFPPHVREWLTGIDWELSEFDLMYNYNARCSCGYVAHNEIDLGEHITSATSDLDEHHQI